MASSVVVAPTQGSAPLWTNGGVGDPAGAGYFATSFRRALALAMEPGVRSAGSFRVQERGAGPNRTVDVVMDNASGGALIRPQSRPDELYDVPMHSDTINLDVPAAHATNPTVHRVILIVEDNEIDASGQSRARVYLASGTPTAGATLNNANGAPTLPNNALHLGYVLVPANATTVVSGNISSYRQLAYSKGLTIGESKHLHHDLPDDGWVPEDGRTLPFVGYGRLASKLGAAADFTIPDTRGRVLVAVGTHGDVSSIGANDGAAVASRTPKHSHTVDPHSHVVNAHDHSIPFSGGPSANQTVYGDSSLQPGGQAYSVPTNSHGHGFGSNSGASSPGTSNTSPGTDIRATSYQVVRRVIFTGTVS